MRKLIVSFCALLLALLIASSFVEFPLAPVIVNLFFGWLAFLNRVGHKLTVNWDGVLTAAVCLLLIYLGVHAFLRWLVDSVKSPATAVPGVPSRRWKWRWTAAMLVVGVLMFVAGLAFIGIVHQALWLATAKQPHLEERVEGLKWIDSADLQREIGSAVTTYRDVNKVFPPRAKNVTGKHSWLTMSLPYASFDLGPIDYNLDWDHAKNKPAFRRIVLICLHPEIGIFRNADGYAVSHFAGNVHVLGTDAKTDTALESEGGTSNVILAGEVDSGFKAWGDPSNLRDPDRGFNGGVDAFGGPSGGGAQMLLLDGSVRFFSNKTSSSVRKSLSRPID